MIKSVTITNHLNSVLKIDLTDTSSGFAIMSIDGLGPVKADVNTTDIASFDGALYNSARVGSRNIVFNFRFFAKPTIEATRLMSYKIFPVKRKVKLEFETDTRTSSIEGYVESNEPDIFSENEGCQVSIICPDPYFVSSGDGGTEELVFSTAEPNFEFPFSNELDFEVVYGEPTIEENLFYFDSYTYEKQTHYVYVPLYTYAMIANGSNIIKVIDTGTEYISSSNIVAREGENYIECQAYMEISPAGKHIAPYIILPNGYNLKVLNQSYVMPKWITCIGKKPEIAVALNSDKKAIELGIIKLYESRSLYYTGDIDTGVDIEIHATGSAKNISIYNTATGDFIKINTDMLEQLTGSGIINGDTIYICTVKGKKSIKLLRAGIYYNILNCMDRKSTWFQLVKGENLFSYNAEYGSTHLQLKIKSQIKYEGV